MNKNRKQAVIGAGCSILFIAIGVGVQVANIDLTIAHIPIWAFGVLGLVCSLFLFIKG
jgi:hypothetical protein